MSGIDKVTTGGMIIPRVPRDRPATDDREPQGQMDDGQQKKRQDDESDDKRDGENRDDKGGLDLYV